MTESIDVMVTGDLHLGRHPTKIPEQHDEVSYSPGKIWEKIVEESLRREVDAVVVTGDIVDRENHSHEGWGPFEKGMSTLEREGIPAYVVSGNHDAGFVESFLDSMDVSNCHLLGRNATWTREPLVKNGEESLYFDGWSYPETTVRTNPLNDYDKPSTDLPTLGVVHSQVDEPGSRFAPTRLDDLKKAPVDAWLLGHVHTPRKLSDEPLVFYPGSPQPLDPGETGVHGPWLVSVETSGLITSRRIPLASLEYVRIKLDVTGMESSDYVLGELKEKLRAKVDRRSPGFKHRDLILVRLILTGATESLEEFSRNLNLESDVEISLDGCKVLIEDSRNNVRQPLDLEELSTGSSPVAYLAKLIRDLERNELDETEGSLVEKSKRVREEAVKSSAYRPLLQYGDSETVELDDQDLRDVVVNQGRELLYELLSQKAGPPS